MPQPKNLHRCAILDDYQNIALKMAAFGSLAGEVEFTVFNRPLGTVDEIARALKDFDMVVLTRERTAFPKELIEALPKLRLIVSTGSRNWMLDGNAAKARGIPVCGTPTIGPCRTQLDAAG